MPENYTLSGICRQDGKRGSISGEVVIYPQTRRMAGKMHYDDSPGQNLTIEGRAKHEGLQAELDFIVNIPGSNLHNSFYRVRGNPSNGSFAGTYQGSYVLVGKDLGMRVVESGMAGAQAQGTDGEKHQYAQITLVKAKEKKRKKK